MKKPYIPRKESEFVNWSINLITVAKAHKDEWKLDDNQLDSLKALALSLKALHEKCRTSARTVDDMKAKKIQRLDLKSKLEKFVQNNLQHSDYMTDDGRTQLGITIRDTTRTHHEAPNVLPNVEVETPRPRTLKIKFRDPNSKRWGKVDGAVGFECLWVIADELPKKLDELIHSNYATRSPMELIFDEDMRGKRVYFVGRWEGSGSTKGPVTDVFSAIVP